MSTQVRRDAAESPLLARARRLSSRFRATASEQGLAVACGKAARKIWGKLDASRSPWESTTQPETPAGTSWGGRQPYERERSFDLKDLLACPQCASDRVEIGAEHVRCRKCGASYERILGTPMFLVPGVPAISRLDEPHFTHPYGEDAQDMIRRYASGVILDYGAGHTHPDHLHPNVLLHEVVQYNTIDVVSFTPRLPYRDNSFDAIISQAVFEHVPRPWEVTAELHRVLKPGGEIHIDTAFMQPYHSDPFHFFNMTIPGLREIFRPFREVRTGVKPYQLPSFGYRMQFDVMLQHLAPGPWRDRIQALRDELERDGWGLDNSLTPNGQLFLAAGVYFHGTK